MIIPSWLHPAAQGRALDFEPVTDPVPTGSIRSDCFLKDLSEKFVCWIRSSPELDITCEIFVGVLPSLPSGMQVADPKHRRNGAAYSVRPQKLPPSFPMLQISATSGSQSKNISSLIAFSGYSIVPVAVKHHQSPYFSSQRKTASPTVEIASRIKPSPTAPWVIVVAAATFWRAFRDQQSDQSSCTNKRRKDGVERTTAGPGGPPQTGRSALQNQCSNCSVLLPSLTKYTPF
jgi:hypothetical protein